MAQSHLSDSQDVALEIEHEIAQKRDGFATNPASRLVEQYERIAREQMCSLPFYHPAMPILVECALYEGQWLGVVLTPWMLSVVVLPGPDQCWPDRSGERLALQLPCGNLTFMVGELPELGQLLSCSLMSPLDPHLSAKEGTALVGSVQKMLLSLPVQQDGAGVVDLGRRRLLGARQG